MREVFQSPCFNRVREANPDFVNLINQKIEAIEGDIVNIIYADVMIQSDPKLIFNEEKKREIIETCHIIINNAASIDFNMRLDEAIQINFYGPRRILDLAK